MDTHGRLISAKVHGSITSVPMEQHFAQSPTVKKKQEGNVTPYGKLQYKLTSKQCRDLGFYTVLTPNVVIQAKKCSVSKVYTAAIRLT